MQCVDLKTVLTGVRPGDCVQPYLEGFAAELISAGYAVLPVRDYVRSAAHLGRWLDSRNMGIERLTEKAIAEFAQHECECLFAHKRGRRPSRRHVARVRRFATYLARLGVVPAPEVPSSKAVPELLVEFRGWMTHHCGVQAPTVNRYQRLIEKMLPALGDDPSAYNALLGRQVLLRHVDGLSCGYAKTYVVALRAFLRFLATQKRCRSHLDRAVPTVPEWKLSALPRYLETDDVKRVIASCGLSKPHGVRDRAIVLRHESSDTTAYYAKVDIELLRQIAQPWPEGAPC